MRILIVGYGVQGKKRYAVADAEVVAIVDPVSPEADYQRLSDVPLSGFDLAFLCVPDDDKLPLLEYLLKNGKPTLVEKPLWFPDETARERIQTLAKKTLCYTAYNHRYEPQIMAMKACLAEGVLGRVFAVNLFYGNGTAQDVRTSPWRDHGSGVIRDLAPHLLDLLWFWFGSRVQEWVFAPTVMERFETKSPDYALLSAAGPPRCDLQVTLLSWRNTFRADLFAEKGSAHVRSLCKWGPSTWVRRYRTLPSGRPREESLRLVQGDDTWALEQAEFIRKAQAGEVDLDGMARDTWIQEQLCQPDYGA